MGWRYPDTGILHGFVCRFPMKGYVVGPLSAINGKVYREAGPSEIALLPLPWAEQPPSTAPLFTVGGEGYQMPDRVPTGTRHEEIIRYVASRWNGRLTKAEIARSIGELIERFEEPISAERLAHEIDVAWDSAIKKWGVPAGATTVATPIETPTGETIVIDPLAIETRIDRPTPLDMHAVPMPTGISMLLDHLTPLTDAPFSSLTLASVVGLAGLMGNKPTLRWRGTQRLILYGALVGDSNYGRKGQAINEAMATLAQIDPLLDTIKEPYIPSSGPAFIDSLAESSGQSVLMVTTEMGRVLANCARENETLSYDMRDAWDGVPVGGRTRKTGKINARDYHLSIMAATTPEDLAKLTDTDLRNGWANRWLWFWAEKRPGGFRQTYENKIDPATATFIRDGIDFARARGGANVLIAPAYTMGLTAGAEALLDQITVELDVPAHGTVGVLRQRMPPIAVRIAMIAACLDQTRDVDVEHLEFGFGLTDYAVQSIRAVFGTRVEDPVAMNVLDILAQAPDGWLNTSTIAKALSKSGDRVNRALHLLVNAGLIVKEERKTAGRTAIGYKLTVL